MPTQSNSYRYHIGELFSGAGGMALGAHIAKVKGCKFVHAWANDNNKDACETLKQNITTLKNRTICQDVKKLDFAKLPNIDGLCFGFPCNDFSVVGKQKGISGQYGGLYLYAVKALRIKKPLFFVAENVGGIKSSNGKQDFDTIFLSLEKAGYKAFSHKYKFEEYGIPQARHRIIIIGFRKDLGIESFNHPKPKKNNKPKTAREALNGLRKRMANNEPTKQSSNVVERLKHIKPGENAFTADLPPHLKLNIRGARISQIYRRLKPNEPSYTITGSGGGGTHLYHWKENRALTNRERARLQTFPDSFVFCGGKESVRQQIGMAVPPMGAKIIFRTILTTLIKHNITTQTR